jgi:hypothetical protein
VAVQQKYDYSAFRVLETTTGSRSRTSAGTAQCECKLKFTAVSSVHEKMMRLLRDKYRAHLLNKGFRIDQHPSLKGSIFAKE